MADTKITALDALTAADPANDVLPIVDVNDPFMAASGTTKKISINNILGASGTATLASATISGDLTVDTSTLKVDSANNRVGVGTATPGQALDVVGSAVFARVKTNVTTYGGFRAENNNGGVYFGIDDASGTFFGTANIRAIYADGAYPLGFYSNASERYRIASDGVATWSNVGGVAGTAMTLNSTGLGVGAVPSTYKLEVGNGGSDTRAVFNPNNAFAIGVKNASNQLGGWIGSSGNNVLTFSGNDGTMKMTIDSSGNVGIGVAPSAWSASWKTAQVGSRLVLTVTGSDTFVGNNWYNDGAYKFINADYATYYDQTAGKHVWGTSTTSGAVNGVITWDPAMTLDASGNLYVGVTSSYLASRLNLQVTTAQPDAIYIRNSNAALSTYWRLGNVDSNNRFNIYNQSSVGVYLTDGATSWTGTSDERLKDIIEPISNAVAKVGSLRSVIGKFKTDSEGTRRSFLIAQDVQAVLPEAVDTTNADAFGVRYSEVIPLLVAAIKELTAEVNALKNA